MDTGLKRAKKKPWSSRAFLGYIALGLMSISVLPHFGHTLLAVEKVA